MLWYGNEEEKKDAGKYLIETTGCNYAEVYKYLVWYRKNLLFLDY